MKTPTLNLIVIQASEVQINDLYQDLKQAIDYSQDLVDLRKLQINPRLINHYPLLIIEPIVDDVTTQFDQPTLVAKTATSIELQVWSPNYPLEDILLQDLVKNYQLERLDLSYYQPENDYRYGLIKISPNNIKTKHDQLIMKQKPDHRDFIKALDVLEHQLLKTKQSVLKL